MSVCEGASTAPVALPELQHHKEPLAPAGGRLIFVTNRGPVEHSTGPDGILLATRGAGGVVSGLLCAAEGRPVSWISLAMTEADRAVAETGEAVAAPDGLEQLAPRLVAVDAETYRRHYYGFSNRALWFVLHGMRPTRGAAQLRANWEQGYLPTNEAVARAVIAELTRCGGKTPIIFHDYHLYLAPSLVRRRAPDAHLQHFIHTPWPSVGAWSALPADVVRAIYLGLAGNDVIGMQTERDVRHFLQGAARYLPEARMDSAAGVLRWQGRRIVVRAFPIAVTPASVFGSAAESRAVAEAAALSAQLRRTSDHRIILRVDRVEPTKNILRGFHAYERLLGTHPELRGNVTFLALLVPTREGLAEYRAYARQVRRAIRRLNARFGEGDWQPVVALFGNDHARALACMRDFDVLLVNPLIDGMNLVAKEGGLLNQRDGVLVLSERAGAHAQLADGVLGVDPRDVVAAAEALYAALAMPPERRAELAARVRETLLAEDAGTWLEQQLTALPDDLPAPLPALPTVPAAPSLAARLAAAERDFTWHTRPPAAARSPFAAPAAWQPWLDSLADANEQPLPS